MLFNIIATHKTLQSMGYTGPRFSTGPDNQPTNTRPAKQTRESNAIASLQPARERQTCCWFPWFQPDMRAIGGGNKANALIPGSASFIEHNSPAIINQTATNQTAIDQTAIDQKPSPTTQLSRLLQESETIKATQEFASPPLAIKSLQKMHADLTAPHWAEANLSPTDQSLRQLALINVTRGLMNAYRFQSQDNSPDHDQAAMLRLAHRHATELQSHIPEDPRDILTWLDDAPEVDKSAFYATLCNDLGKYLKGTIDPSLNKHVTTHSLKEALGLLNDAIAFAPEDHPTAAFSREAWVDTTIKHRLMKHGLPHNHDSSHWLQLFNNKEIHIMRQALERVVTQAESNGNTDWTACQDAKTTLAQINTQGHF